MKPTTIKILITSFVVLHLAGSIWHGVTHSILEVPLSSLQTTFIVVVVVIAPVLGAILIWTRHFAIGNWIVGLSMLGSCLFGVYNHYVLVSMDNVDYLPPGSIELQAQFTCSAEFIALIALAAALFSFYSAGKLASEGDQSEQ